MNKQKAVFGALTGVFVLAFLAIPVSAQSNVQGITGGSRSSDYQPPTDNPQNEVSKGLQQTDSSLQPLPNQKNFSQQNLSGVNDLRVAGTAGDPNPNTTSTSPAPKSKMNLLPHVLIGIAVVAGIVVVVRSRDDTPTSKTSAETPEKTSKPEPLPVQKKATKKATKKKPAKKRKTKK